MVAERVMEVAGWVVRRVRGLAGAFAFASEWLRLGCPEVL
jgi:hypothetical protein